LGNIPVDHDLAVSGADLASTAWRMSLIDEVHLFIAPILVGGGQRMFPEQIRHPLSFSTSVASATARCSFVTP
jgi:dihydrofolate reductase